MSGALRLRHKAIRAEVRRGVLPDRAAADRDAGPREGDEDPGEHDGSDALAIARESLEETDHGEDRGDDGQAAAHDQPDEERDGHEYEASQPHPERRPGGRIGS